MISSHLNVRKRSFRIVSQTNRIYSLSVLDSFEFRKGLDGRALIRFDLEGSSVLAVGTVLIKDDEEKPSHGEIYFFRIGGNGRKLQQLTMTTVNGAVYSLAQLDTNLVACVNNKVRFVPP